MSKQMRRGAMYNYLNLILIIVSGALLTPFIMRSLGPSQYGLYLLVGSLIPYFALLDIGMGKTTTRYVAHYRARHDEAGEAQFLNSASRIYIIITAIVLIVGALLYCNVTAIWGERFTPEEIADMRRMVLIVVTANAIIIPGNIFTAICNGCGEFAFTRGVLPIKYLIRIVCIVALLLMGTNAVAIILLETVLNIAIVVATYIHVKRRIGRRQLCARTAHPYKPIIRYTGWIALYGLIYALQWNIAPIIASMSNDTTTVAIIGVGVLIGNIYGYFAETINKMMMPTASTFVKEHRNGEEVTGEMSRIGRIITLTQLLILGAFIIFGKTFVSLWAGEGYEEAYYVVLMMMLCWSVQQAQDYGNSLLEAIGEIRYMSIINFTAITAGIVAACIVAPTHGIMGIMTALGAGTIVATVVSNLYYRRKLKLDVGRYMRNVYARPVAMVAAILLVLSGAKHLLGMEDNLLWLIGGGATYVILYAAAAYRWLLNDKEREYIRDKCKR